MHRRRGHDSRGRVLHLQSRGSGGGRADARRGGQTGGCLMPETILVVDDDPDIARFVEVNLRSAGYDVAVASDGEEALQRASEMRPDLVLLDVMMPRIDGMVRDGHSFAVLYCDLDNFKAYNDQKGFVRGDRLIQSTARIIQDAVAEFAGTEGFVGHVGGDDFVAITPPDVAEEVAKRIVERFDAQIHEFYDPEDLQRGFVEVEDRKGVLQRLPLVGVSSGIATTTTRRFAHYGEAGAVATELKHFAT